MRITISTNGHEWTYDAATGQAAVQLFFDDIRSGKVDIHNLGLVGEWSDGGEAPYPFRIGPALYQGSDSLNRLARTRLI